MSWLARLFPSRKVASTPASPAPAKAAGVAVSPPASATATAGGDVDASAVELPCFLPWLLDCAPLPGAPSQAEALALASLDQTLALPALPEDLLPRAAALIPQLLALLRQSDLPVPAMAQRVAKDVVLSAEVLRLASSPYYRAQGGVTDMAQAIALIGTDGLRKAIARVVLKPIFDAAPGALSARAAEKLRDHAEALAGHAATQAAAAGLAAFDGYLVGLLYGSGWTMALRLLDRASPPLTLPVTEAFAIAVAERAHRLFGQAAQRWTITPAFTAFSADARETALAKSTLPLAMALRRAQALALAEFAAALVATDGVDPAAATGVAGIAPA
jgi:hypothetical protein